ncbi:hypothetical protein BJX64DRAFT_288200 [Aspergillus heterothallicus]
MFGNDKKGHTTDCVVGNEAYCCAGGSTSTLSPRGTTMYADQTAADFDAYLTKFLENPICPGYWEAEYSAEFDFAKRDLDQQPYVNVVDDTNGTISYPNLAKRATSDQANVLYRLLPMAVAWITSQYPRTDLDAIWDQRLDDYGLTGQAANSSDMRGALYGGSSWTGYLYYEPEPLIADEFCHIAESSRGLQRIASLSEEICVDLDDLPSGSAALEKRVISVVGTSDRSGNEDQPSITFVINGILNDELSLHYLRWLPFQGGRTNTQQVILEMAFWLGPIVGVRNNYVRERYRDRSHTAAADRWVVFHLHIAMDERTFFTGTDWNVGVTTVNVYHSQTIARPRWVTTGWVPDWRAQWQYSTTYRSGSNGGQMQNYNSRTEMTCGNFNRNRRLYIGPDRQDAAQSLSGSQIADNPYLEAFLGLMEWIHNQGVFSVGNLVPIFPTLAGIAVGGNSAGEGWQTQRVNGRTRYSPRDGAFDQNWLPNGETPLDPRDADP